MRHPLPTDQHGFIRFGDVRAQGRQAELRAAVARGEVESARRGLYRTTSAASRGGLRDRGEGGRLAYLSDVRAVARTFDAPVFTSYSAAVLLGLPIIGAWPSEVFILSRGEHGRRRSGVIEVARTRPTDVTELDGFMVTSVEFTLLRLARHAPLVAALTATDAALRVPRFGDAAPLTTFDRLAAEHERLEAVSAQPTSRRRAHPGHVAGGHPDRDREPTADRGARIRRCRNCQHELWLPELGRRAFLDFFWPDVRVGAEADGRGKYRGETDAIGGTRGRRGERGGPFGRTLSTRGRLRSRCCPASRRRGHRREGSRERDPQAAVGVRSMGLDRDAAEAPRRGSTGSAGGPADAPTDHSHLTRVPRPTAESRSAAGVPSLADSTARAGFRRDGAPLRRAPGSAW